MIKKYYKSLLILILAFSFFTRIYRLNVPERYIFDEVYHAITAKLISRNDPRAYEWWNPPVEENTAVDWLHPPLAKYTQAFSIKVFGENSFGWRFSSVIFGVGVIYLTAILADELFDNKKISLLAAFLASLDGLLLVQSRIAMNDIHVTFFILITLIFYTKHMRTITVQTHNYASLLLTGVSAGLAIATKWSGLFAIAAIGLWELITIIKSVIPALPARLASKRAGRRNPKFNIVNLLKYLSADFVLLILLPATIYVLSYSHMFLQGKTLFCNQNKYVQGQCYNEKNPLPLFIRQTFDLPERFHASHFYELHRQIIWYQTHLDATHTYQSRPLEWMWDLRPVWIHVDYIDQTHIANIYAFGNPSLFWLGNVAVIFSLIVMLTKTIIKLLSTAYESVNIPQPFRLPLSQPEADHPKGEKGDSLFFLLLSYFTLWLPWQLSPRIMFFYHYAPAVPLLSIILAYWLIRLSKLTAHSPRVEAGSSKLAANTVILLPTIFCLLTFLAWFPHWTAIPVPKWWADHVYFAINSWK